MYTIMDPRMQLDLIQLASRIRSAAGLLAIGLLLTACGGGTSLNPQTPLAASNQVQAHSSRSLPSRYPQSTHIATTPVAHPRFPTALEAAALVRDGGYGDHAVDPLTLHPPAILEDGIFFSRPYRHCWTVGAPPPGAPTGTAIVCYSGAAVFIAGDGSLANDPDGHPDTYLSGFPCPPTGPPNFATADKAKVNWVATRFYDASLNLIEGIRPEQYNGKIYNTTTGTAAHLFEDALVVYLENPPDGTRNHEYLTLYGNDFGVSADGKVLAHSGGLIEVSPTGQIVAEEGPHPLDNYFLLGDASGLLPVCNELQ